MSGPELFGVRLNSFEGLCWENIFVGVITVFRHSQASGLWKLLSTSFSLYETQAFEPCELSPQTTSSHVQFS